MDTIRTLAVDDNAQFLDSLAEFLASFSGIEIVGSARSASDALDCLADARPDLVLVDLVMPGMDGLELTERLKALPDAPRVVILTLAEHTDYESHVRDAGADGLLRKYEMSDRFFDMIDGMFPDVLGRV